METLFKDAVVKDISGQKSGSGGGSSVPNLPSGIPGRSGGMFKEVLYDQVAHAPVNAEPGKTMWLIKG